MGSVNDNPVIQDKDQLKSSSNADLNPLTTPYKPTRQLCPSYSNATGQSNTGQRAEADQNSAGGCTSSDERSGVASHPSSTDILLQQTLLSVNEQLKAISEKLVAQPVLQTTDPNRS